MAAAAAAAPADDWTLWHRPLRPWHALLGVRLRPPGAGAGRESPPAPLILLPDALLHKILRSVDAAGLGACQCVCRALRAAARDASLWRTPCLRAWQASGLEANHAQVDRNYGGDWRRMFLDRPRVRTDGLYVSRNTYIHKGVAEWDVRNSVHLVCYYRYLRFFGDGTFLYKTTPNVVAKVAPMLLRRKDTGRRSGLTHGADSVIRGRWKLKGDSVYTAFRHEGSSNTEIRSHLRVRSRAPAGNDRLDILKLMSYSHLHQEASDITEAPPEGSHEEANACARGTSTYVFMSWRAAESHELNLPIDKLDFYIPG